jgi:hypothetical protein
LKIQQTQMTTPTKDTLLALLKRKELSDLADDLEKGKTTFEELKARTEAQWKDIAGIPNGIDIYNALHPNQGTLQHAMRVCLTNFTQGQRRR